MQELLPIWQPVGASTHIIAKKVSDIFKVKTSHTGTLDPMAEGVIIILLGEHRNKKYEYAKWEKEYLFEILFGIETDTLDGLGLIRSLHIEKNKVQKSDIENIIKKLIGNYTQDVPAYSAIKVKGKPMHWYARNNKLQEINHKWPVRKGLISDLKLISLDEIYLEEVSEKIVSKINKISGNLRQEEAINSWKYLSANNINRTLLKATLTVEMSKGLYVRKLVEDICVLLNTVGFTFSIKRTKNGLYTKENSKTLDEIGVKL